MMKIRLVEIGLSLLVCFVELLPKILVEFVLGREAHVGCLTLAGLHLFVAVTLSLHGGNARGIPTRWERRVGHDKAILG